MVQEPKALLIHRRFYISSVNRYNLMKSWEDHQLVGRCLNILHSLS